ncbi:hypothetical protein KUH32_18170 [Thalassococcus sp. CAU 1522]|uniref:DUF1127 domain-containing protein n=1 Tax=Thalassococcus arenae TaxID=2851652 RepID=A0ABS6NCE2_9RHOB|nr:hypothetical protein [Thalassococcus arenae]MBV2361696.1 hypothetical protein [Thalassococcus arenae]
MADITSSMTPVAKAAPFRPLAALWSALTKIGENSHRAQLARKCAQVSQADLDRMGLTRAQLVQRAFSIY